MNIFVKRNKNWNEKCKRKIKIENFKAKMMIPMRSLIRMENQSQFIWRTIRIVVAFSVSVLFSGRPIYYNRNTYVLQGDQRIILQRQILCFIILLLHGYLYESLIFMHAFHLSPIYIAL